MKNTKIIWTILISAILIITLYSPAIKNPINSKINDNSHEESGHIYKWKIKRVVDGDTVEISENFLPSELKLFVRLKNIDTPEKSPRAKCEKEDKLAQRASEFTKNAIELAEKNGQEITFSELKWDKYGGRILAVVKINNRVLAEDLMENGLAREYHGEKKRSWCN